MEIYADTKMAITKNQTADEVCVLNYDDEITKAMADKIPCKAVFFSRKEKLDNGVYLNGDSICLKLGGKEEEIIKTTELKLLGAHNVENVMAAIAIADAMGVDHKIIHDVIRDFRAVEHRIEFVETVNGVDYYNDSKGTNPDASIQAVKAMTRPTFLIGGGYDKGSVYDEWIATFPGKVKTLILMGQTADKIEETARRMGFSDIVRVNSMEEAVRYCYDNAKSGDAVLLSPCCASWGMFKNYEERGEIFKNLVRALPD
jgi:UDP-N-acetylmuramoylalanine--D-glutamate ligase